MKKTLYSAPFSEVIIISTEDSVLQSSFEGNATGDGVTFLDENDFDSFFNQ